MAEYPTGDEEFEFNMASSSSACMNTEEFEMLEEEELMEANVRKIPKHSTAKKSLDFSHPKDHHQQEQNQIEENNIEENMDSCMEHLNIMPPASKKRTVDDIFGDIGDIDFGDTIPSKKQRTEEEVDMDLITKILNKKRFRQLLESPACRPEAKPKTSYDYDENISRFIPRLGFIAMKTHLGDKVFVKCESEESWEQSLDDFNIAQSLDEMFINVWEDANKILDKKGEESESNEQSEVLPFLDLDMINNNSNLWVDKYKPDSYLDLLTDEPINRTVLHWLHLWDKIVFKKEVKVTEPQQRTVFSKRAGQFQLSNKWKGKKAETGPEIDEDGRPHNKVVLLCGPPGVGKTTLAHLLAKLAGYRPVEMNASDERSVEAFSTALKSATLMRSVLDAEKRPNCLVLDEIDGAPLPTVELLVKWCTATASENKKKGKTQPLRRPVICICNDLYAPALRPLRAVALIVHVTGVSDSRLRSRLGAVCEKEGLSIPSHVLAALAQRVKGDIRTATTTLQFFKNKHNVTIDDVTNLNVGEKDCHKSVVQALQAIFTINDNPNPMKHVLNTINAAGEYDRIMEGIFENYLKVRFDARLQIACTTMEWLELYDIVHSSIMRQQNYSLYSILPLCAAGCYTVLATRHKHRLLFPLHVQEVFKMKTEIQGISESLYRGTSPSVMPQRKALMLDIVPLLPYLLAPKLRSANVQLCSENERKALCSAASAMCDYGIQYIQQRNMEGYYDFLLEPQIYKIAFFGSEDRLRVPPAVRQALAREQQLEQIKRLEEQTTKGARPSTSTTSKPSTNSEAPKPLPNHLQRLEPKIVKSAPRVHKDFFGRLVPISETLHRADAVRDVISSSKVCFRYQEGYNNAVRKTVRIRDLL